MSKVSLQDIAQRCGVSHVTVSRVLNGKDYLHKTETVERVLAAAKEMGYRPNVLAKSILSGRTRTVGFLYRAGDGGWTSDIQTGIHEELVASEYFPITLSLKPGVPDLDQVYHLLDRRVDGVIIRPSYETPMAEYLDAIRKHGIPIVTLDTEVPETQDLDFVGTDDELGGRLAAEHLLELGHRCFGVLTFEPMSTMSRRRLAFEETVKAVSGTSCHFVTRSFLATSRGHGRALELLGSDPRPTAIFAGSDLLACGVYQAAAQLGIRIPEDLSLVGFADLEYAKLLSPPLTTIRQLPERIGRETVKLILGRIDGKEDDPKPRRICLKPEIVVRESTRELQTVEGFLKP